MASDSVRYGWMDVRSLGLARILFAMWYLWELKCRYIDDTAAWYISEVSDDTVPIQDPKDFVEHLLVHQLLTWRGTMAMQHMIAGAHAFIVVLWGLGIATSVTGVGCWLGYLALYLRALRIVDGADQTAVHFAVWFMLLPCGAAFTLPGLLRRWFGGKRNNNKKTPDSGVLCESISFIHGSNLSYKSATTFTSMAAVGLSIQICLMYWTMLAKRSPGHTWTYPEFSATYYAMLQSFRTTNLGAYLVIHFPYFAYLGTIGAVVMEVLGPLLLAVGTAGGWKRRGLGILIIVFGIQLPLSLVLRINRFQSVASIVALPLIPSAFWDTFFPWTKPKPVKAKTDDDGTAKPSSATAFGSGSLPVKRNPFTAGFTFLVLVYTVIGALGCWPNMPFERPQWFLELGDQFQFNQHWNMFSPNPPQGGGFWVIQGVEDGFFGEMVDMFDAIGTGNWSFTELKDFDRKYGTLANGMPSYNHPTFYWEKIFWDGQHMGQRVGFHRMKQIAKYLCHEWQKHDPYVMDENGDVLERSIHVRVMYYNTKPPFTYDPNTENWWSALVEDGNWPNPCEVPAQFRKPGKRYEYDRIKIDYDKVLAGEHDVRDSS